MTRVHFQICDLVRRRTSWHEEGCQQLTRTTDGRFMHNAAIPPSGRHGAHLPGPSLPGIAEEPGLGGAGGAYSPMRPGGERHEPRGQGLVLKVAAGRLSYAAMVSGLIDNPGSADIIQSELGDFRRPTLDDFRRPTLDEIRRLAVDEVC
uniref:Uncharacterized protein n=1 Tax=Hyaloperonospora arabidopsidis (strain Emoy2) TaxID=559515 RepID=M4BC48_HYAAE